MLISAALVPERRTLSLWKSIPFFVLLWCPKPAFADCASYCQGDYWACIESSDSSTCLTQQQICVQRCVSTGEGADSYGAIAYSPSTDAYGYSYGHVSRAQAEDDAMSECRHAGGDSDCEITIWFRNACGSLATDGKGSYGTDWAETKADAEAKAMAYCHQYARDPCAIRQSVCSN